MLPLFIAAHFSHHFVAALLAPLLPYIRDSFSLDYTKAGLLISAFNLAYGLSQLPGGWLGDRAGSSKLVATGVAGVALSGLLVGLSSSYVMIAVLLVFMGIFGGGYHPSASSLVSVSVGEKYRGRALGIHQLGGTASFFLAPIISVSVAKILGWRSTFLVLSAPVIAFGVVLFLLLRSWGYDKSGSGNENRMDIVAGLQKSSSGKSKDEARPSGQLLRFTFQRLREFAELPGLVPVIILNSAVQAFLFSMVSFIPFYVVDSFGGSKQTAASLLSIAHFAGFIAGPSGGYLSDRARKIIVMLIIGVTAGSLIYLLKYVSMGWSISLVAFLIGLAAYMSMPVTETYIIERSPEQNRSTLLGVYYFAARTVMGLLTPAIGFAIDRYGFHSAFTFFGVALAVMVIACAAVIFMKGKPRVG